MIKFNKGIGLDVLNPGSSLNVGSRSYINGYDQPSNNYSPLSPGFVEESAADPQVLFTSIFDDTATTTLVPNPINVTGEDHRRRPSGPSMWGSVGIQSGGIAVINAATFTYGGGSVNTQDFTIPSQSVLAFISDFTTFNLPPNALDTLGSHVYITNNNFYDNFDAAMQIEPNGLLAGDPHAAPALRPSLPPRQRHAGQRYRWPGRDYKPSLPVYSELWELPRTSRGHLAHRSSKPDCQHRLGPDRHHLRREGHDHPRARLHHGVVRPRRDAGAESHRVRRRARAHGLAHDPGRSPRHFAGRRRDHPQPRSVGHREVVQRQEAEWRRRRQPGDPVRIHRNSVRGECGGGVHPGRRRRRRSPGQPAARSGCRLRVPHPRNPGKSDDRPAAGARDHHLAARRQRRHHGARREDGQDLELGPGGDDSRGRIAEPDHAGTRRRRLHLHRRPVDDRSTTRPTRWTAAASAMPTSAT